MQLNYFYLGGTSVQIDIRYIQPPRGELDVI